MYMYMYPTYTKLSLLISLYIFAYQWECFEWEPEDHSWL